MQKTKGIRENYSKLYGQKLQNMESGIEEIEDMLPHREMGQLSFEEKKFLLAVERGDVATSRR